MERLLLLKLSAWGCAAEAALNGVPLLRVGPGGGSATLAVHEYVQGGVNRLEMTIDPGNPAEPAESRLHTIELKDGTPPHAECRLLLPRMGHPVDENHVRTLGDLPWAGEAGQRVEMPLRLGRDVDLPIAFPRWRWCDAPVTELKPALIERAHELLHALQQDLARGQTEGVVQACRLRTEELALAYQRKPAEQTEALREHLTQCSERSGFAWTIPGPRDLRLRPLAGGRLFECLDPDGLPALRTAPAADGTIWSLPLRLAAVEGKFYVLR